ncbi:MAG: hypothetical protein IIA53_09760 [Chloroflexi bacterium]|nr:hypothetical protein [Chloroflexota bacterium]
MVGTITAGKRRPGWLAALIIVMLMAVAIACGSSDEPSDAGVAAQPASATTATNTPAPIEKPAELVKPSFEPIVPAVEPEAGSDEAAVLEVFRSVISAMNAEDWVSYVENCNSELGRRSVKSAEEAESVFELAGQRIELASYNRRNVTVRLFDDGTAITTSDEYRYNDLISEGLTDSWEYADERWYAITLCGKQPFPSSG